jgi:hypothetical protein
VDSVYAAAAAVWLGRTLPDQEVPIWF